MIRWFHVGKYERGFLYHREDFVEVLGPGQHVYFDPLLRYTLQRSDVSVPQIGQSDLEVIVKAKALGDESVVLDVKDHQRALVWIDGRLMFLFGRGLYAFWTVLSEVDVEILDARVLRLEHKEESQILSLAGVTRWIDLISIGPDEIGLLFVNGIYQDELTPGRYLFWKGEASIQVRRADARVEMLDVQGQEIMTSDKVTLRLNAIVSYRLRDVKSALGNVQDYRQAIYREAQLALRQIVGTKSLDELLTDKDKVASELAPSLSRSLSAFGTELTSFGIRDIVLPGDMKTLLNKVTEAQKAAEANLITRREETAALRSQLNAAKMLESNPTLMRLRELEVLENVASQTKLSILLGDTGLSDKLTKLI